MKRVIVFGLGKEYEKRKDIIEKNFEVVCLIDNFKSGNGIKKPEAIIDQDFDIVVITPSRYTEMRDQLRKIGVPEKKIRIDYFDRLRESACKTVFGLKFYSQHGEDLIVSAIFQQIGIKKPSYMDLGANSPFLISNTALMYASGCRGINIDASPDCIEAFKCCRPEDINLNLGVAEKSGILPFYMVDEVSGLNSFDKAELEQRGVKPRIIKQIPVVTLEHIVKEYCKDGLFPDYFDCDIEGFDLQVLRSYPFEKNGPKVICVECSDTEAFNTMLDQKGYFKYCRTGSNNIYVKKEYSYTLRYINL